VGPPRSGRSSALLLTDPTSPITPVMKSYRCLLAVLAATASVAAQVTEVEYNDTPDYATPIGAATTLTGTTGSPTDVDWWEFQSTGELIRFDGLFEYSLRALDGSHLSNWGVDSACCMFSVRNYTYVPPGTYRLEHSYRTPGPYTITCNRMPAPSQPLLPGANQAVASAINSGPQVMYGFTLAADARVQLAATAAPSIRFELYRADGLIWYQDAVIDSDLPAGSYLLRAIGSSGAPCTIQFTETPGTFPDLFTAGPQTVSIPAAQARRLYRLSLPAPRLVRLSTARIGTGQEDTLLYVFDRHLRVLAFADDTDTVRAVTSTPALLTLPLPAGDYFVGARLWHTLVGSFTVSADCSQPFPTVPTGGIGANVLTLPGNGVAGVVAIDSASDHSVRIDATAVPQWTVWTAMDDNGICLGPQGWDLDPGVLGPTARYRTTGCQLHRGRTYLIGSNRFWSPVQQTLTVRSSLQGEGTQLVAHGRSGDFCLLFADFSAGPGVSFQSLGIGGTFALPFPSGTLVSAGLQSYPANGAIPWLTLPPALFGMYMQHGDLFAVPTPLIGAFRDRILL